MHEPHARRQQGGTIAKRPDRQPLDDWLGEISDEDWSEAATELAGRRRAMPARQEPRARERDTERHSSAGTPAQAGPFATTETRRAAVERRRAGAAVALLLLIGIAAAAAVLTFRNGVETPSTPTSELPTVTVPAGTEATPAPSTTPSTTTPTAPSDDAPSFALPEGTKLQRGEDDGESNLTISTDAELVEALQRVLVSAGYDPGTPDGTFGQATEKAVIAFQQANGLSPDGIVGPGTADALSRAVARG